MNVLALVCLIIIFGGPRQTYLTVRRGKQFFMCTIADIKKHLSKGSDLTKIPLIEPKFENCKTI